MDFKKAKKLVEKIQKLFTNIEKDPADITRMERDLMLNYLRELYDQFLEDRLGVSETQSLETRLMDMQKKREKEMKQFYEKQAESNLMEMMEKREAEIREQARLDAEARVRDAYEQKEREKRQAEEKARLEAARKAEESAALRAEIERKAREEARKKAEHEALVAREKARLKEEARLQLEAEEKARKEAAAKRTVELDLKITRTPKAKSGFNEDFDELFAKEETRELSQKLSERPVKDINLAISINDRMLYTNELFQKKKSAFDQAIADLNRLHNMEEARTYMEDHLIDLYDWTSKKRMERARKFVQLVRRRYL
ncbi:MAG: hypothetical protein AAFV80_18280 [Bacteroidota bacterium]